MCKYLILIGKYIAKNCIENFKPVLYFCNLCSFLVENGTSLCILLFLYNPILFGFLHLSKEAKVKRLVNICQNIFMS